MIIVPLLSLALRRRYHCRSKGSAKLALAKSATENGAQIQLEKFCESKLMTFFLLPMALSDLASALDATCPIFIGLCIDIFLF